MITIENGSEFSMLSELEDLSKNVGLLCPSLYLLRTGIRRT